MRFDLGLRLPSHWGEGRLKFPFDLDFHKHGSFFRVPNKFWEIQVATFNWTTLFELDLEAQWTHRDHGGLQAQLTILGFYFSAQIYDSRHWNNEAGRWYEGGEEEKEWEEASARNNAPLKDSDAFASAKAYVASRAHDVKRRRNDPVEIIERLLWEIEK